MAKKSKKKDKKKKNPSLDNPQVKKIRFIAGRLQRATTYQDVGHAFHMLRELESEVGPIATTKEFNEASNKMFGTVGVTDMWGYRPQGSTFASLFPNPFHIYGFLAENHWAILDCRNAYWREILSDGYRLEGNKANMAKAKQVCKFLKMKQFRAQLADHAKTYGNFWVRPTKSGMRGIKKVEILLPPYLRPIPTVDGQHVKFWQYQRGTIYETYKRDELLYAQFRPSMRQYDLGNPPLGAVLVDIEADMAATMYNNMVFQKGGLIGLAILLDNGAGAPNSRRANKSAYAEYLQAELNANNSGARTGYQSVVFENTKSVEKLNDLNSLDGAFHKTSDKTAKQIAHVMGVPHEMIGIITNANQQYHPSSMMDYSAKQFDKSIAELMDVVDTFINTKIFPMFGIMDVRVKATPRYNSVTRVAAQAGTDLGGLYGVLSVNEYRTEFLGRPPIEGGDISLMKITPSTDTPASEGKPGSSTSIIVPPPMPPIESPIEDDEEDEGTAGSVPSGR